MRKMRQFAKHEGGIALLEFALLAPFLILLFLGAIELGRYILIMQKVEKASYVLTDMVSQYEEATTNTQPYPPGTINQTEIDAVFAQYTRIMSPYGADSRQRVIVTSVTREGAALTVKWQVAGGGTLTDDVTSIVNGRTPGNMSAGSVRNTPASFPAAFNTILIPFDDNDNMVVGEVFYRYSPILRNQLLAIGVDIPEQTFTRYMFFKPRQGAMNALPPNFPV